MNWHEAESLLNLGELGAQWLEGKIDHLPAYGGTAPDPETEPLIPALAALNRAGFFTENSQPGELTDHLWQRATVSGFCDEELAIRIHHAIAQTGLIGFICLPDAKNEILPIPVTLDRSDSPPDDGQEQIAPGVKIHTWTGCPADAESIDHFYVSELSPAAVAVLHNSWQLEIVDPVWGRNDLLWPVLVSAVGRADAASYDPDRTTASDPSVSTLSETVCLDKSMS